MSPLKIRIRNIPILFLSFVLVVFDQSFWVLQLLSTLANAGNSQPANNFTTFPGIPPGAWTARLNILGHNDATVQENLSSTWYNVFAYRMNFQSYAASLYSIALFFVLNDVNHSWRRFYRCTVVRTWNWRWRWHAINKMLIHCDDFCDAPSIGLLESARDPSTAKKARF